MNENSLVTGKVLSNTSKKSEEHPTYKIIFAPDTEAIIPAIRNQSIIPTKPDILLMDSLLDKIDKLTNNNDDQEQSVDSEQKDPEDHIVNKNKSNLIEKVELRKVLDLIIEYTEKIKQYGFQIDVEYNDSSDILQIIFKIEKGNINFQQ